jgi:hypothetical protein
VGRVAQFRHSVNTGATEGRLRRLIRDFHFAPVREVLGRSGALVAGDVA